MILFFFCCSGENETEAQPNRKSNRNKSGNQRLGASRMKGFADVSCNNIRVHGFHLYIAPSVYTLSFVNTSGISTKLSSRLLHIKAY